MDAWITSAVADAAINKAIVLAGSLRRVRSAKKLAVLTTNAVSQKSREKLKLAFDLVLILEQEIPNDGNLEDYAKVEAFSLTAFNKCVYLSANALVLRNCDEMFDKYGEFAVFGKDDELDFSVYLFTPSLKVSMALRNMLKINGIEWRGNGKVYDKSGDFDKCLGLWIKTNIPNWEKLDEEYNVLLRLNNGIPKSLGSTMTIVKFGEAHPLDLSPDGDLGNLQELGTIEKFVVQFCRRIFREDVLEPTEDGLYSDTIKPQLKVFKTEPIAIIGMAFRLPDCNNVEEFWNLLDNGRDAIKVLPQSRWTQKHTYLANGNQDRKVEAGFLTVSVDEFDANFFGISGKEAELMDPQQRILHEVAWEALEETMIDPVSLRGTQTGVFVGSWLDDYKDMVRRQVDADFFRVYMGNSIATGAARLSHFLEVTGPSVATESGCSSAIVAVDMACKSLRNHDSSLALACGVNLILKPFDKDVMSFIVSPDGRCKTFDEEANGYGRAEGCAVLIMKRLSDAMRDEDNIWGLIRGSAITQEGVSRSLGTPTVRCESLAMQLALKDANVDPLAVSYIEAHGTGTPVGDPMEIAAIAKAYSKGRSEPLVIGSVKTNVGHTESVSGLTGIIKVLLSMKNEKIPKHLNLIRLNPAINLDVIPAKIPLEAMPWPKVFDKPRIAGVSSFGITGTDGHAIIQEPPVVSIPRVTQDCERPLHIFKISAKSPESFHKLLEIYENMLVTKGNDERFADLAYSANTGRATFNHRAVIIARDFEDANNILKAKTFKWADVQSTGSQLCFLFTGQGSQYPNMAATLFNTSPIFRDEFNKCDQFLTKQYGINLKEVLWENPGDGKELSRTLFSQTSIFCVEYCLLKLWESWGVKPDFVLGHSLGEFTAAVAAGALDFEDALMLVAERSLLIDNLPRGKMLVIQADKKMVDRIINEFKQVSPSFWVDYAAINASAQTVVAGDSVLIEEFAKYCRDKSLKTTVLAATHAFHSRQMEPMLEAYRRVAQKAKPAKNLKSSSSSPKYISGMEGKLIELKSIDADYWVRHTREPVNFQGACKISQSENCSLFLELGPHPVLSALVMMNMEGHAVTCLPSIRRNEQEWVTMLESLGKLYLSEWKGQVDWKRFDRYYKRTRVSIPFYPFNRKSVWTALETELPIVHPLLGKLVPTDCEHSIFESRLTLKNTSFIQDHVIGNTVVFPGAAFLEMCLTGGFLTAQKATTSGNFTIPKKPVILRRLKIVSPLAFYDSGVCRLQTSSTLDIEENNEISYSLRVTRHIPSASGQIGEWITHATAKFFPVPPQLTMKQCTLMEIDIPFIQSSWEKTNQISEFYDKLEQVGLHFGPKFRSLDTVWKSEKGMLFGVKMPKEGNGNYLIHPVIADAMIQATMLWTSNDRLKVKLQVPVQIGEFRWLQASNTSSRFIYCSTNGEGKTDCILLDEQRTRMAQMTDVDFVETSVKLVEGAIQQQTIAMPKLWREMWRNSPGIWEAAYDLRTISDPRFLQLNDQHQLFLAEANDIGEKEKCFYNNTCNLTRLFFLNSMYELGWKPKQGNSFSLTDLINMIPKPKEHFKKYIRFFLRSMADVGMLEVDSYQEDKYYFGSLPPIQADIEKSIKKIIDLEERSRIEYQMVVETGRHLSKILLGKVEALQILFPDDPNKPNANKSYHALAERSLKVLKMLNEDIIMPMFSHCYKAHTQDDRARSSPPVLRVLEVGAGTGVFSRLFLDQLEMFGKPIEYYFTDISPSFFEAAEKKFAKYSHCMVYKKFDMEEDAMAQGLCPQYFDMIVGLEVLHVAKDIRKTLRNLKRLLKPGGIFQISETTQPDPVITQIFGLLEGYWQFEDLDFRPNHATLTPEKWDQALREINCDEVICTPVYNNNHSFIIGRLSPQDQHNISPVGLIDKPQFSWLIFYHQLNEHVAELLKDRLVALNRKAFTVKRPPTCTEIGMKDLMKSEFHHALEEVDSLEGIVYMWGLSNDINRDQSQISLPLINLVQEMMKCKAIPRLYVLTQGTAYVDGSQVTDPTAGTLKGIIKSLSNENISMHLKCLDLCPDKPVIDQVGKFFPDLLGAERTNGNIAYRDDVRSVCKLIRAKVSNNEPLPLPSGCTRYQLQLPHTKVISDLEFGTLGNYTLGENEVEVQIKATALNFRDVFTVLKPIKDFEQLNTVGTDFAGVVTQLGSKVTNLKVGVRVAGLNNEDNLSFPSHISIEEPYLILLPSSLTFAEGATLPIVFSTAVHCLLRLAKMKRGDTVLIHTASGGVGLSAIQLATYMGAEIIATAGSIRKQNYLRNLGIKHIFHSRTTQFTKQILELTNGRGVDIVLNSITGEGFKEASLAALAQNGRFIEMSKLNVWRPEEVKEMRPDVFYQIMDLTAMDRSEIKGLFETLKEFLAAGYIRPIPYERFDAVNVRGALGYLQKAKHIGKIVCVMPEVQIENSKISWTTPMCNELSTYLVTGGLGGIGLEVIKWMLKNGAKHIAIASRSEPKAKVASQIESWNKGGNHVESFAVDIGDYHQCQHLFQQLQSPSRGFPQLRGVMHVAGVLADATLQNQTWSKFNHTYNPKVNGTWNLHELTKNFALEHFVVFSSMAAAVGSPGQSNHAASNSFEDSLIAYRQSNGLPGTTINWGNWGETGVATEVDLPGIRPITTSQGLLALETFLKTQTSHMTVSNVESFSQALILLPQLKNYVEDIGLFGDVKATVTISSDELWKSVDNAKDRQGRLLPFKTLIKSTLKNILKIDQDEQVSDTMDFQALGIDSLMKLELKNGLQNILGSRLVPTVSQLKDCNNTEEMANQLLRILDGEEDDLRKSKIPTMEELRKLVREDSILPEELRPSEEMSLMHVSEIKNVLVAGVTGTLGPYILRELSNRPNIKKIYCLVRKTMQASPMEKLLKRLHTICIVDQVDLAKVECIQGDVTEDKFGLTNEEYDRLANDVDAIFNSAVRVDYIELYHRAPKKNKLNLRSVNVKGTIRILKFAVHTKLKHVYHASTLLTVTTTNDEGCALEDWQDVDAFDQVPYNWGYPVSKHISEQLCRQAVERGIPCKVFRLPLIGGDGKTGRCEHVTNHFALRWLTYLKLNCMPDTSFPLPVISVDHCAEVSLDVFFHPRAPLEVYNVANGNSGMDLTIIKIAEEFGIYIKPVSFSEFAGRLKVGLDNSPLAPFQTIYEDEGVMGAVYAEYENPTMDFIRKHLENTTRFFESRKLPQLIQNYESLESTESVMRRDLMFLKESGVFEKFGIPTRNQKP